jgi:phosphate acetyltransferase
MQIRAYIGAMMVKMNQADGMVCGLTFTTADTLRPALQIIKTKPNVHLASSIFWMQRKDENYFFTDCALNINPTAEQLADITKMGVQFAVDLNVPDVEAVLLSYSTKGSGSGIDAEKVRQAVTLLTTEKVNFTFDGEMQFDAAFDQTVRQKKAPNSPLKKPVPDVFVFPEIQSANIGYKIAQRLGGFEAFGPFILGLNQPVNDLSRGASLDDVLNTAILTAFQALKGETDDSRR